LGVNAETGAMLLQGGDPIIGDSLFHTNGIPPFAVTFVSVTQSFNTTTSMGRLTLNILLSFPLPSSSAR
jgi:hypothetical protein